MQIAYVAHPIAGNVDENLADIARILRIINLNSHPERVDGENFDFADIIPCAPYYGDIIALDDSQVEHRKKGISNNENIILSGIFDILFLTGEKLSLGMEEEVKLFKSMGRMIVNYIGKI